MTARLQRRSPAGLICPVPSIPLFPLCLDWCFGRHSQHQQVEEVHAGWPWYICQLVSGIVCRGSCIKPSGPPSSLMATPNYPRGHEYGDLAQLLLFWGIWVAVHATDASPICLKRWLLSANPPYYSEPDASEPLIFMSQGLRRGPDSNAGSMHTRPGVHAEGPGVSASAARRNTQIVAISILRAFSQQRYLTEVRRPLSPMTVSNQMS